MFSKANIQRMRETYRSIRRRMGFKKYKVTLPDFPNNDKLEMAETVVKQEKSFVFHQKQTITQMHCSKHVKIGKFSCQKSCVVTVIIRTDIFEMGLDFLQRKFL